MTDEGKPGQSLLERLLAEAAELGRKEAADEDFAVNLKAPNGAEVTGIPISKAAAWLRENFGIGEAEEGGGDGGTGKPGAPGAQGGQQQHPVVASLFRGGGKQQQPPKSGAAS